MAINPPTDVVLDVARAADPARQRAAIERLLRVGGAEEPASPPAARIAPGQGASEEAWTTSVRLASPPRAGTAMRSGEPSARPFVEFEAMVLQSFLQSMMPKHAPSVFGAGTAGEFWKSMLAEKLALEIARGGGIGIAERVAAKGAPPIRTATPVRDLLIALGPRLEAGAAAPDLHSGEAPRPSKPGDPA